MIITIGRLMLIKIVSFQTYFQKMKIQYDACFSKDLQKFFILTLYFYLLKINCLGFENLKFEAGILG